MPFQISLLSVQPYTYIINKIIYLFYECVSYEPLNSFCKWPIIHKNNKQNILYIHRHFLFASQYFPTVEPYTNIISKKIVKTTIQPQHNPKPTPSQPNTIQRIHSLIFFLLIFA